MAVSTHTFQAPKGTRDFYPPDLAVRRYIENVWREVSINHGFEEIDGPTFEHLDLYTAKSGPGIVSELFSFRRAGGDVDYALRPEFTPTLARMYAAQASSLPKPTKWFSIGPFFRAERPQRGRLREHLQWNLDIIGDDSPQADAEVVAVALSALDRLRLAPDNVTVKISHRQAIRSILLNCGVPEERIPEAFDAIDHREKMGMEKYLARLEEIGMPREKVAQFPLYMGASFDRAIVERLIHDSEVEKSSYEGLLQVLKRLEQLRVADWVKGDFNIVRGLAYYTGTVFEIHETAGKERAIAGGGRYDNLVELFGGPPTPACGFAMGDVVLRLVLEDHGLLEPAGQYTPRPDAFVISAGKDEAEKQFRPVIAMLRKQGLHVRHSYRSTRNVGKLLGEAAKTRARHAVILGDELKDGNVVVKDLDSGKQETVKLDDLADTLRARLNR